LAVPTPVPLTNTHYHPLCNNCHHYDPATTTTTTTTTTMGGVISVAMAIADVFQNNRISVGSNLVKILKIFEKIDEAKSQGVI
jgi:hypothetical protein